MKKTLLRLLLLILCVVVLVSCGKDKKPSPEVETPESQVTETETAEGKKDDNSTTDPKQDLAPGIQGPKGWPEDVPTPVTGEFLWGDWSHNQSFYTVDIRYTQAEIDAYAIRLQQAGFIKKDTDKYGDIYGDAGVYANDKWEIVLGDEGVNGDYTYISLYPLKPASD